MEIESLRLDFQPKNKILITQNATPNAESAEKMQKERKKKRKRRRRRRNGDQLKPTQAVTDPGRA